MRLASENAELCEHLNCAQDDVEKRAESRRLFVLNVYATF